MLAGIMVFKGGDISMIIPIIDIIGISGCGIFVADRDRFSTSGSTFVMWITSAFALFCCLLWLGLFQGAGSMIRTAARLRSDAIRSGVSGQAIFHQPGFSQRNNHSATRVITNILLKTNR